MKLWNVKNSECVKSMEVSEDDATVWALAVSTKEDHIVTGASNSTLILWKVTVTVIRLFIVVFCCKLPCAGRGSCRIGLIHSLDRWHE